MTELCILLASFVLTLPGVTSAATSQGSFAPPVDFSDVPTGGGTQERRPPYPPPLSAPGAPTVAGEGEPARVLDYVFIGRGGGTSLQAGSLAGRVVAVGPKLHYGFTPVVVAVDNVSATERTARLEYRTAVMGGGAVTVTAARRLPPHGSRIVHLPAPTRLQAGRLELEEGGGGRQHVSVFGDMQYWRRLVLAVGEEPEVEAALGLPPLPADLPQRATLEPSGIWTLPPELLPAELAALFGFDAIFVTESAFDGLSASTAELLERYVATGGRLLLAREGGERWIERHVPSASNEARVGATAPGDPNGTRAGARHAATRGEGLVEHAFGDVALCPATGGCARMLERLLGRARPALMPTHSGGQHSAYGVALADRSLLSQATPPLGLFVLGAFFVVLLLGPGSLLVSRRLGPAWLLLALPAFGLLASCGLLVGSVGTQGLATHARVARLTLLEPGRGRAVELEVGGHYANLTPEEPPTPADEALFLPSDHGSGRAGVDGQGASLDLEWGGDSAGLFPARTYREWGVGRVVPSRARLRLVHDEGAEAPTVYAALGGELLYGVVRVDGALFGFGPIPDGGSARAAPFTGKEAAPPLDVDPSGPFAALPSFDGMWPRFSRDALRRMSAPLEEGGFWAALEGIPGADPAVRHHDSVTYVRGRVE